MAGKRLSGAAATAARGLFWPMDPRAGSVASMARRRVLLVALVAIALVVNDASFMARSSSAETTDPLANWYVTVNVSQTRNGGTDVIFNGTTSARYEDKDPTSMVFSWYGERTENTSFVPDRGICTSSKMFDSSGRGSGSLCPIHDPECSRMAGTGR